LSSEIFVFRCVSSSVNFKFSVTLSSKFLVIATTWFFVSSLIFSKRSANFSFWTFDASNSLFSLALSLVKDSSFVKDSFSSSICFSQVHQLFIH